MQMTFGDAEDMGKRKRTHREIFLSEMDKVVPRAALLALIALSSLPTFWRHLLPATG